MAPAGPDVLPGRLTLLVGDPGTGKGVIAASVIAATTNGTPMMPGSPVRPPANVLWLDGVDNPEDTLIPRLIAAGARRDRVQLITPSDEPRLMLPRDIEDLRTEIRELPAALVVIDPLFMWIDERRGVTENSAYCPLADLAADTGAAVLVATYPTDTGRRRARLPLAAARAGAVGYLLGPDPGRPGSLVMAPLPA